MRNGGTGDNYSSDGCNNFRGGEDGDGNVGRSDDGENEGGDDIWVTRSYVLIMR